MVESDIRKLKVSKSKRNNIRNTIKEIERKKEIIICLADKGGGLVILNKSNYETEMNKLLKTPDMYKKLKGHPKSEYEKKLKLFVKGREERGILTKKEARYLIPEAAITPVIYYVPKIHKSQSNPPGRPIISGIDSLFSRLGAYIDG